MSNQEMKNTEIAPDQQQLFFEQEVDIIFNDIVKGADLMKEKLKKFNKDSLTIDDVHELAKMNLAIHEFAVRNLKGNVIPAEKLMRMTAEDDN